MPTVKILIDIPEFENLTISTDTDVLNYAMVYCANLSPEMQGMNFAFTVNYIMSVEKQYLIENYNNPDLTEQFADWHNGIIAYYVYRFIIHKKHIPLVKIADDLLLTTNTTSFADELA